MKIIYSPKAPLPIGPYSQAVIVGNMVFLSGQIGINPEHGQLESDVETQAEQVCKNIGEVLRSKGYDYKNVAKTTIFLRDINDFQVVNSVYGKYFSHNPARSTVEVSNLPKGAMVEIECIAVIQP